MFDFIRDFIEENGMSPTQVDIALAIGLRQSGVGSHLLRLEIDGFITREKGRPRTIRIVEKGD